MCFRREDSLIVTVLWDFAQNEWAAWWTDCALLDVSIVCFSYRPSSKVDAPSSRQICLKERHIFYIHRGGLHAHELPPLSPVNNQTISVPAYGGEVTVPSFIWRYNGPTNIAEGNGAFDVEVDPDTFNPSKLDSRPMVYEIMEKPKPDDTIRLRRYRLPSYAELTESPAPKLGLVETCHLRKPYKDGAENLVPLVRRTCDGRLATLWTDDSAYPPSNFFSITPPSDCKSICPDSPTREADFSLVRIITKTPDSLESGDQWQNIYHFCAVSGTLMIIRDNLEDGDFSIQLYRFL